MTQHLFVRPYTPPRPHRNGAVHLRLSAKPKPLTWRERLSLVLVVFGIPLAVFLVVAVILAGLVFLAQLLPELVRRWR